jgi:trehalose/maltose hydrolase-like predicted phosphorylase
MPAGPPNANRRIYAGSAVKAGRWTSDDGYDLADTHAAIAGGLHMAALSGTWITAVVGFAGLSLRGDGIALEPKLPESWRSLGFGMKWRGRALKIRIAAADHLLQATLEAGDSMTLLVNGLQHQLRRNEAIACPLNEQG